MLIDDFKKAYIRYNTLGCPATKQVDRCQYPVDCAINGCCKKLDLQARGESLEHVTMFSSKDESILMIRTSPISGMIRAIKTYCSVEQYEAYIIGVSIQDVFQNWPAGMREFLKTGITDEEWDDTFGRMEEEKEEEDRYPMYPMPEEDEDDGK